MEKGLESLILYIKNNTLENQSCNNIRHESIRSRIKEYPSLVGISYDHDLQIFDEVKFPKVTNIMFIADSSKVYIVEVKSTKASIRNGGNREKNKLKATYRFIKSRFSITPEIIIAYGMAINDVGYTRLNMDSKEDEARLTQLPTKSKKRKFVNDIDRLPELLKKDGGWYKLT